MNFRTTIIYSAFLLTAFNSGALAGGESAVISPSPRSHALGQISAPLVDESAPFHNPAAVGMYHLDHKFSFTANMPFFYSWFPAFADDMSLRAFSASVRVGGDHLMPSFLAGDRSVIGISLSLNRLVYGSVLRTDAGGNGIGVDHPREATARLSVGVATEGKFRFAYGLTSTTIVSALSGLGSGSENGMGNAASEALDFGMMLEGSLLEYISGDFERADATNDLVVTLAYTRTIHGTKLSYIDQQQADESPKIERFGIGLLYSIKRTWGEPVSVRLLLESEKDHSDIFVSQIRTNKAGLELTLAEFLYLRAGRIKDDPFGRDIWSGGFGLSLRGYLHYIKRNAPEGERYSSSGFDLRLDYARYDTSPLQGLSGTSILRLSMAF